MLTSLDTVIDHRLEATRVLSLNGLRLEAIGISTSAYIIIVFLFSTLTLHLHTQGRRKKKNNNLHCELLLHGFPREK